MNIMRVVVPLPPDLDQKVQGMALANEAKMLSRKYDDAQQGFLELYELLLRAQPSDDRYHKGYPLHQIGLSLAFGGKAKDALYYFILAYIEDLLSKEAGQEASADQMPAGLTLRQGYKVKPEALAELKAIIIQRKNMNRLVKDPKRSLRKWQRDSRWRKLQIQSRLLRSRSVTLVDSTPLGRNASS